MVRGRGVVGCGRVGEGRVGGEAGWGRVGGCVMEGWGRGGELVGEGLCREGEVGVGGVGKRRQGVWEVEGWVRGVIERWRRGGVGEG